MVRVRPFGSLASSRARSIATISPRRIQIAGKMASSNYTTDRASPFTRAVVNSMRKLYPEDLADKSFDNTGLLLEAPFDPIRRQMNSVLLTVDLTKAVADEAIQRKDCVVVAYHPIIFKGIKALTLADTQQQSLLRLALEGISVYCPHTAVDAVPGGMGDWLADIVTGTVPGSQTATSSTSHRDEDKEDTDVTKDLQDDDTKDTSSNKAPTRPGLTSRTSTYSKPTYPKAKDTQNLPKTSTEIKHTRSVILTNSASVGAIKKAGFAADSVGMGRFVRYASPQPLPQLIERIAHGVGSPKGFPVAIPQNRNVEDIKIRSVAVCAGSGQDVLSHCPDADLLFTGELSHHDALRMTEQGKCVVTLFHSNSERGYLGSVMRQKLLPTLREEWARVRQEIKEELGQKKLKSADAGDDDGGLLDNDYWEDALQDENVQVEVSERDRDPFGMVLLQSPHEGQALS